MTRPWNADKPLDDEQMRRYEERARRYELDGDMRALLRLTYRLEKRRAELLAARDAAYPDEPLVWPGESLVMMVRVVDLKHQCDRARRHLREKKRDRDREARRKVRDERRARGIFYPERYDDEV